MPTQGKVGGCQRSGQQDQRRGPAPDQPPCLGHRRACTGPALAQEARGYCHQLSQQAPRPPYAESAFRPLISRKGQELKFPRAPWHRLTSSLPPQGNPGTRASPVSVFFCSSCTCSNKEMPQSQGSGCPLHPTPRRDRALHSCKCSCAELGFLLRYFTALFTPAFFRRGN